MPRAQIFVATALVGCNGFYLFSICVNTRFLVYDTYILAEGFGRYFLTFQYKKLFF